MKNIRIVVMGAMFAALTFVATTVIKIPTPTMGYVHPGDGFVILSGFLLGPFAGGLAAGTGSMLSDLLGGYVMWAPGTFVIKFITAYTAGVIYRRLSEKHTASRSIISGVIGEIIMITGYFLFNILILTVINAGDETVTMGAAVTQSVLEIPFNVAQGIAGIIISTALIPVLEKIKPSSL